MSKKEECNHEVLNYHTSQGDIGQDIDWLECPKCDWQWIKDHTGRYRHSFQIKEKLEEE